MTIKNKKKYYSFKNDSNMHENNLQNVKNDNMKTISIHSKDYLIPDDIVIYSSPDCFFCNKLKQMLYNNNLNNEVTIIEDKNKIPKEIDAFPYIISKYNNVEFAGCPNTIEEFLDKVIKK